MNQLDPYSGDPRIVMNPSGATLKFEAGQPVMDGGFENAVMISLFSKDWVGNLFLKPESRLKSHFEAAHEKPITLSTLADIESAAKTDLAWMIKDKIFSKIDVETVNTGPNITRTVIDLWLFDSTFVRVEVTKTGQNWLYQMFRPANERI